jgi:hypothetical protein
LRSVVRGSRISVRIVNHGWPTTPAAALGNEALCDEWDGAHRRRRPGGASRCGRASVQGAEPPRQRIPTPLNPTHGSSVRPGQPRAYSSADADSNSYAMTG